VKARGDAGCAALAQPRSLGLGEAVDTGASRSQRRSRSAADTRGSSAHLALGGASRPLAPDAATLWRFPFRALPCLALLAAACVPPALDETGLRCSAERPCSEDYFCVERRCSLDAAVPDAGFDAGFDGGLDAGADAGRDAGVPFDVNLLQNPGFEELAAGGGVRAWRATSGGALVTAAGRSGLRAGKVVPALFESLGLQPSDEPVTDAKQGQLYCARVYVKTDITRAFNAVLQIRDRYPSGVYESSNGTTRNVADGGWVALEESYSTLGLGLLDIRVGSTARTDAGDTILVDDALLFRSSKPTCVFP
jgi:hypothetical protein